MTTLGAVTVATLLACGGLTVGGEGDTIPFPDEYRAWAHVESALVGPQSPFFATEGGIHHIYGNATALEGYRTGKFPDGSILVYDLLDTKEVKGVTIEGPQRRVDVMVKESLRHRDTGGWGFATFAAGDRRAGALRPTCFSCHASREAHDFVFSEPRKPGLESASSKARRRHSVPSGDMPGQRTRPSK